MTDMRATERLLEMLALRAETVRLNSGGNQTVLEQARALLDEIQELRRRGDTLVRRDDLRLVLGEAIHDRFTVEQEFSVTGGRVEDEADKASGYTAAMERLQTQIGGTL